MLQKRPFRRVKRPFRKINCTVPGYLPVRLASNAGNERIDQKDSKQSWPGEPDPEAANARMHADQ